MLLNAIPEVFELHRLISINFFFNFVVKFQDFEPDFFPLPWTTFGLSGWVLEWFQSYISDRIQSVLLMKYSHLHFPYIIIMGTPELHSGNFLISILYTRQPVRRAIKKYNVNKHMYSALLFYTCYWDGLLKNHNAFMKKIIRWL